MRALRQFESPEVIFPTPQRNIAEDLNLQQYNLEKAKSQTTKDVVGPSSATLSSETCIIKARYIKLTVTSVALQLVLTQLYII